MKRDSKHSAPAGGFDRVDATLTRLDLRDERLRLVQKLGDVGLRKPPGLPRGAEPADKLHVQGVVSCSHSVCRRMPSDLTVPVELSDPVQSPCDDGGIFCKPLFKPNAVYSAQRDQRLDAVDCRPYRLAPGDTTVAKRHGNRVGDLESMFLRLEELVLANSGEDEFEEVFKLLVAKLWAERSGEAGRFAAAADEETTYAGVVALLRDAERAWPGIVEPNTRPSLTPEHLQVCVEALARHTICDSSLEVLDGFFEFMVSRAAKGSKGQYFTPRYVVEFCVRMLRPRSSETVLDPACGSGGFLVHALNYVREQEGLKGEAFRRFCESKLWAFDIDPRAVRVAKALMVLAGDGRANVLRLNSLLTPEMGGLFPAAEGETLLTVEDVTRTRTRNHKGFDVILTNPPFAGEVRERQVLDAYDVSRGKARIERDVLFLERCVELLRPGGRMAMVLPHNKFAADEFGDVRQWLLQKCRVLAVVGLGRHTFLPHTHQKASILFVQRRSAEREQSREENIFFALSERDGKNSKGQIMEREGRKEESSVWERVDHDFDEIVSGFGEFCGREAVAIGG